jgi:MFS family permease
VTSIGCDAGDPSSAPRRADGPEILRVCPAVFAATVAITRFSIGGLRAAHAQTVLLARALGSAAGAATIAAAPNLFVAALGLALAAAGTAVLFPTLLGIVSRNVDETHRGRATSIVTTVSYLGFLLGPVYVECRYGGVTSPNR